MTKVKISGLGKPSNPISEESENQQAELYLQQQLRFDDAFIDELNSRIEVAQSEKREAEFNKLERDRLENICIRSYERFNKISRRGLDELARLGKALYVHKELNRKRFGDWLTDVGISHGSANLYMRLARNPKAVKDGVDKGLSMRRVLRTIREKDKAAKLARIQQNRAPQITDANPKPQKTSEKKASGKTGKSGRIPSELAVMELRTAISGVRLAVSHLDKSLQPQIREKFNAFSAEIELLLGGEA